MRFTRRSDGMQVSDADNDVSVRAGVLQLSPLVDCTKPVADVRYSCRLNARHHHTMRRQCRQQHLHKLKFLSMQLSCLQLLQKEPCSQKHLVEITLSWTRCPINSVKVLGGIQFNHGCQPPSASHFPDPAMTSEVRTLHPL